MTSVTLYNFSFCADPLQPPKPVTTTISSTSIFIQWAEINEGPATKTYNVSWRSEQEDGFVDNIKETSVVISNLKSNVKYFFNVSAVNAMGSSENSESTVAITCKRNYYLALQ